MVDWLADTPVGVSTATWEIVQWNALWAALLGDPSPWRGWDRNLIWRYFSSPGSRVRLAGMDLQAFEQTMVADLRVTAGHYPDDPDLADLITMLRAVSSHFVDLWHRAEVEVSFAAQKTVEHPVVGMVVLDCDVLTVPESDLRVVVYAAQPDTEDAEKLDLLRVAGIQDLSRS